MSWPVEAIPPVLRAASLGGRVVAEDLHPVPLHRQGGTGEGYMVCDDCGVLAELSAELTLN